MLLPAKPYPSVEGIKTMMEIYDYREMRIHRPEDFYDASFISELDKSGYIDGLYKKSAAPASRLLLLRTARAPKKKRPRVAGASA